MLYTVLDLCRKFNLSETAVRNRLNKSGVLPAAYKGKRKLYDENAIQNLIEYRPDGEYMPIAEIAEKLGLSHTTIQRRMVTLGIKSVYQSSGNGRPILVCTKANAEKLLAYKVTARKNKKDAMKNVYFRVSVLVGNHWFVRHVVTQEQAEKYVAEYFENGEIARLRACR